MEIFGLSFTQFCTGVFAIVLIDLTLAGDNAIVIGMACRNLPKKLQMKAICLGTTGAIIIRILATLVIVWLLRLKGLMLGGGLVLIWISYKLLAKPQEHDTIKGQNSLFSAICTIIVADAAMGIDNMLAVAGAAHGSFIMIIIGLSISIPIMVIGSTLIIKLMDRFSFIVDLGAAIIAYTGAKMITEEPLLGPFFLQLEPKYLLIGFTVIIVLLAGHRTKVKS